MPDYDLSRVQEVLVSIIGKVLDEKYTRMLIARTDLDLWDVIALDKVQKGKPLTDDEFDLIVSGLVLEHLRELDGFFREIKRVLKTDGRAVVSAMHPAMFLRGSQARFTDPTTGELVQPGSIAHSISEFVMAAVRARLQIADIEEVSPDAEFAEKYPRADKYVGWPILVVLRIIA